jgi:CheY-like chemotaxis protein
MLIFMFRILFLSANPAQTDPLELIKECNLINQKIRASAGRELLKLEQRHDISIKWLIEELLNYNPKILHFSGHGSETSALIFKNENTGQIEEVPPSALSKLFKVLGKEINLVFLNACYSEKQARAIAEHVDCVIGMSTAISDIAAIEFASTFYSSLGFGRSVEDAFDLALIQLELLSIPENATPKLIVKEDIDPSKIIIKESQPQLSPIMPSLLDDLKKIQSLLDTNNNNNKNNIRNNGYKIMNNLTSYYNQKIEGAIQELSKLGDLKEKAALIKILWVDDFPSNNKSIIDIYKNLGVQFDIAIDNESAYELLKKNTYNLVITDMGRHSENMAGLFLIKNINQMSINTKPPVIFYASEKSISMYGSLARAEGAIYVTSSTKDLVMAINQIISFL